MARDFGEAGVFRGEIAGVEYDSEDEGKVEPVYVVQYTDGDREDMDGAEVQFAHELHLQLLGIDVEAASDSCGSNDEDSYRPSPKVNFVFAFVLLNRRRVRICKENKTLLIHPSLHLKSKRL